MSSGRRRAVVVSALVIYATGFTLVMARSNDPKAEPATSETRPSTSPAPAETPAAQRGGTDTLVVRFLGGVGIDEMRDAARAAGADPMNPLPELNSIVVEVPEVDRDDVVAQLELDQLVSSVAPTRASLLGAGVVQAGART